MSLSRAAQRARVGLETWQRRAIDKRLGSLTATEEAASLVRLSMIGEFDSTLRQAG